MDSTKFFNWLRSRLDASLVDLLQLIDTLGLLSIKNTDGWEAEIREHIKNRKIADTHVQNLAAYLALYRMYSSER